MKRRDFIGFLGGAAATLSFQTRAQTTNVPRIGYLSPAIAHNPVDEAFENSLQQLGWIIDRDIMIEFRYTSGRQDKVAPIVAEIAALGLDIYVAWGPTLPVATMNALPQRPLVFLTGIDPVDLGLVSNYARPGGNVTGITSLTSVQIAAKRLQLLKEAVPSLARAAIVFSKERSDKTSASMDALVASASSLSIELDMFEVAESLAVETAVRGAKNRGAQAVYAWQNGFSYAAAKEIAVSANANGLPCISPFREGAYSGCLLSYGADLREQARRGAAYVDKILKGVLPGSIPVEQMSKFELLIDENTAKALGLTLSPSLLARADEVID